LFLVDKRAERTNMTDMPASVIRDMAQREARDEDVDVLAVELKGQGSRQIVRVVVDRKGGVSIDVCQRISQRLSRQLDAADPIGGRYTLEVTSPGVDWPLEDRAAFNRVEGRDVLIHRRRDDGAVEQVRGRVVNAGDDAVELDSGNNGAVAVAYDDIVKAAQALPW
jgi:ribosome maturation factor RimP